MAGLACARTLIERRIRVIVLEARDRVGGRVWTHGEAEMGAEFVHGRTSELMSLIKEVGAETTERVGSMLRERRDGGLTEDGDHHEEATLPLRSLVEYDGEDMTFRHWVSQRGWSEEARTELIGYVEGYNAADARKIGIWSLGFQQKAADESSGERSWHVQGGYQRLANYLATRIEALGGSVRLGWEALSVRWRERRVEVACNRGVVSARNCVIALPLGVLQHVNEESFLGIAPHHERSFMRNVLQWAMRYASQ
jgi:monoamine oxidase